MGDRVMKKVMIVEDEELILQGIRNIVDWEDLGLKVVHMAHDGVEALEMWEKEPVHIVVTDISMPEMDGLTLLRNIREKEEQVRFIILTGYDEFAYAREAVRLDVENYILKPINEEELERQLRETVRKLEEMDKKKLQYIDEKTQWLHFLNGNSDRAESEKFAAMLGLAPEGESYYAAVMKWNMKGLKEKKITDMIVELKKEEGLRIVHLPPDSLLMVLRIEADSADENRVAEGKVWEYFTELQNSMESRFNIMTFICIGNSFTRLEQLPEVYRGARKLQKYLIIEGYGNCISLRQIQDRKTESIRMDETQLRKFILKKEKEAAVSYIEDLFINNIRKDAAVSSLYQMAVKMAVLLQDIKKEYKLESVLIAAVFLLIAAIYLFPVFNLFLIPLILLFPPFIFLLKFINHITYRISV
jgi:two-component system response regulator YesN